MRHDGASKLSHLVGRHLTGAPIAFCQPRVAKIRRESPANFARRASAAAGTSVRTGRQSRSNQSPSIVSAKREYLQTGPETFGDSTSGSANWESGDGTRCAKSRDFRRILAVLGKPGRTHECPAGDAVQIAPVSSQIPCKQGILQGKSRFRASRRRC